MKLEDMNRLLWSDAITLLCGDLIGEGITRQVYVCRFNKDYVVKVETGNERFQNPFEWRVWESAARVKGVASWFAPCIQISDAGLWMVQRRTHPVTKAELERRVPRVPLLFTDLKAENWGKIGSRIVCHDYGTCLALERGITPQMRRAEWW